MYSVHKEYISRGPNCKRLRAPPRWERPAKKEGGFPEKVSGIQVPDVPKVVHEPPTTGAAPPSDGVGGPTGQGGVRHKIWFGGRGKETGSGSACSKRFSAGSRGESRVHTSDSLL